MYSSCSGWFLLWASQWPSWTCRWSGCPWALSGHGCCCLKMPSSAPYTLYSSVSGSSSVVNTSWLAGLSLLLAHFSAPSCQLLLILSFIKSPGPTSEESPLSLLVASWACGVWIFCSSLNWPEWKVNVFHFLCYWCGFNKKSKLFSLLPKGGSFEQSILQCVGVRIQE